MASSSHAASRITSIGFIGSGQLAERIARKLVAKMAPPRQRFCYKKQRLVSTLLASDPSVERRRVFDALGFTTMAQNHQILSECDLVFIGTNARDAFVASPFRGRDVLGGLPRMLLPTSDEDPVKNTLFVSLMGDLAADQVERLIGPGARVIRLMPQSYLESSGLPKGLLPAKAWATVRNTHASEEDLQRVMELTGISTCIEITEARRELWHSFNATITARERERLKQSVAEQSEDIDHCVADFHDEYELGAFVGHGRFAQVFKARQRWTGRQVAVKSVVSDEPVVACTEHQHQQQQQEHTDAKDALIAEVAALTRLRHPNVIAHHGFFAEEGKFYLVLDYCEQGSLQRLLREQSPIPEATAKSLMRQLLRAVEYCHAMGHVHRDIKPDNVLLTSVHTDGRNASAPLVVKLADFGLSKELDLVSHELQDVCGTPQYLSPEIVLGRTYGKPADIWSSGILCFMMLSGQVPFGSASNEDELFRLIRTGAVFYNHPRWGALSSDARTFVQRMLDVSPTTRATATELLAHPWLQENEHEHEPAAASSS